MRRRAHHAIPLVRLVASALLFALLLTLAGCGADRPVPPFEGTPTDPQREALRVIESRVAELRQLEPLQAVEYSFMSRESLARLLEDDARGSTTYASEESRTRFETEPVYELLGFISPATDLVELRARYRVEGVAALYDQPRHTIVFVDNSLPLDPPTEVILAHEFVHALQDQHFYRHEVDDVAATWHLSWDADLALNALIEGDATVAMEQYAAMSPDLQEPWDAYRAERTEGTDDRLPDGLGKEYAFPYEAGVAFVEAVLAQGGWDAVNEVYSRPPTTAEQILHPDKYLVGEVGDVAGMGDEITVGRFSEPWRLREEPWSRSYGTLGEFLLRTYLEEELPESEAASAAAGWGGDRWTLHTDYGEGNLLHLVIGWDSREDLDEFFAAYLKWLEAASGGAWETVSPDAVLWHGQGHAIYVCRRIGRAVLLISSNWAVLEEAREKLELP